jgi:hypothetical protein
MRTEVVRKAAKRALNLWRIVSNPAEPLSGCHAVLLSFDKSIVL